MSSFESGLEYLILQLQSSPRLGKERFPRTILEQIQALATTEPGMHLEAVEEETLTEAADPWALTDEPVPAVEGVTVSPPETLETLRERVAQCRKCPHLAAF